MRTAGAAAPLLAALFVTGLAGFGGCGAKGVTRPEAPVPQTLRGVNRIVCLGDSITQMGEERGGYVWLVRHYLQAAYPETPVEVLNAGIGGHKSNDMLARFQRDVLDRKPNLVTISVGVNDVWHGYYDFANRREIPGGNGPNGVPLDAYRRNVEEMVEKAQKAGAKVAILTATPIYEDLDSPTNQALAAYNAALRDIARRHKCLFVDLQKPMTALIRQYRDTTGARDNLLTTDGVHMNAAGNRVMANGVLAALGIPAEARLRARAQVEADLRAPK